MVRHPGSTRLTRPARAVDLAHYAAATPRPALCDADKFVSENTAEPHVPPDQLEIGFTDAGHENPDDDLAVARLQFRMPRANRWSLIRQNNRPHRGLSPEEVASSKSERLPASLGRFFTVDPLRKIKFDVRIPASLLAAESRNNHQRKFIVMGTSRKLTERQIADSKVALDSRVEELQSRGVSADKLKRDPIWRKLNAKNRQINGRLRRVTEIEVQNANLITMKVEHAAKKAAEKAAKPEKKAAAPASGKPAKDKSVKPAKPKVKAEKADKK
jgi:hypothetical protein